MCAAIKFSDHNENGNTVADTTNDKITGQPKIQA